MENITGVGPYNIYSKMAGLNTGSHYENRKSGAVTSSKASGVTSRESDDIISQLSFDDTMTDRDYVLERFIDDYIGEESGSQSQRDVWRDSNSRTVVRLPPLACSKYTVIGDPSMEKRRLRHERGETSTWTLPGSELSTIRARNKIAMQERTKQTVRITANVKKKKGKVTSNSGQKMLHRSFSVRTPELYTDQTPQPSVTTTPRPSAANTPQVMSPREERKKNNIGYTSLRQINATSSGSSRSAHSGNKEMERNTLFDTNKLRKLYLKMAQPKPSLLPGPLECSPRFRNLHVDVEPQLLQEKMLVLGDFLSTSRFQRYKQDRAVIPAGYPEAFRSKTFTRHYVTQLYVDDQTKRQEDKKKKTEKLEREKLEELEKLNRGEKVENVEKLQREKTRPSCIRREVSKCHFCDVIGNKYCKSCIENKNKWFGAVVERRPVNLSQKSLPLDMP